MAAVVVILLGAPGAGKGTQAKRLSSDCSLPHVSTGDLFRENLREDTELGRKAKGYMESGKLVPDALVLDMLFDRVARPDCDEGYVLDGFPRTLPQAEAYEDRLDLDTELVVADLEVPDDVIVERAAGRLLCKQCGNIQHKTHNPPRVAGTCDVCGGELYQRKDDAPDVVRERLAVYHRETAPLVEFYGERDMLTRIDGRRSPEAVYADLLRLMPGALRERGAKR